MVTLFPNAPLPPAAALEAKWLRLCYLRKFDKEIYLTEFT